MDFLKKLFGISNYLKSSFILIRVGKGVGISIYKVRADENVLRKAASQLFKTAYRVE